MLRKMQATESNNTSFLLQMVTSPPEQLKSSLELRIFVQAYSIFVIITGVIGNVCVLIVFISKWKRLKTCELFFISLAVADLIGTAVYPSYIIFGVNKTQFKAEQCKAVYFLLNISITVSSLKLVAVSVDRYIAIKWIQYSHTERKRLCNIMIAMAWLVGAAFATVFLLRDAMVVWKGRCMMNKNRTFEIIWSTVATHSLQTFIPIAVMIILYSLIVYELYKTSANCKPYLTLENYQSHRQKNRKTTKLLIVVIIVFFICVTPKSIFYMLYVNNMFGMKRDEPTQLIMIINSAFTILKMTNSCANPIIYSRLHSSFRRRILSFITSLYRISELYKKRTSTLELSSNRNDRTATLLNDSKDTSYGKDQDKKTECCIIIRHKSPGKELIRRGRNSISWKLSNDIERTLQILRESRYSKLPVLRESVL